MYLKTDTDIFLNTDQITYFRKRLFHGLNHGWIICFNNSRPLLVSDATAQYLIAMLDPNVSLLADPNTPPPTLSTRSRIAIFLRNHPNGATFSTLSEQLRLDTNTLAVALNELNVEGVLHQEIYGEVVLYRHAATVVTHHIGNEVIIDNTIPEDW